MESKGFGSDLITFSGDALVAGCGVGDAIAGRDNETPLFHINLEPDLTQVNFFVPTI